MIARLATACRTRSDKIKESINKFVGNKQAVLSDDKTHLWWEAGIYRSLYRGRYSDKQMLSVIKTLTGWDGRGGFSSDFSEMVADIYKKEYGLTIPLVVKGEVGNGGIVEPVEHRVSEPSGYSLNLESL